MTFRPRFSLEMLFVAFTAVAVFAFVRIVP